MSKPRKAIPEGLELLRRLKSAGYKVFIFTARSDHDVLQRWLDKRGITVDGITSHKLPATAYVDNRAVHWDKNVDGVLQQVKALE